MEKTEILEKLTELFAELPGNALTRKDGVRRSCTGIAIFDAPIAGFGSADDALFDKFKEPGMIGPWHMSPEEWLPGAKTVLSLFFPIAEEVRKGSCEAKEGGSKRWAYDRIDGKTYITAYMESLQCWFEENGVHTCIPVADPRFAELRKGKHKGARDIRRYAGIDNKTFGSRWSERHAAYVCGLGTFGLSGSIITEKGMAGRFASIILDLPLEADVRNYTGAYDYCSGCGVCVNRCPVKAIDPKKGKDHVKCQENAIKSGILGNPRFSCGLCQTKVPCESARPGNMKKS